MIVDSTAEKKKVSTEVSLYADAFLTIVKVISNRKLASPIEQQE